MFLHPLSMMKYQAASVGASGNFTFTVPGAGSTYGDPADVTPASYAANDIMVIVVQGRGGFSHTAHSVSFSGSTIGGTLTKRGGYDNEISDADSRTEMSIWTYDVQSGDSLGNIQIDNGQTDSKRGSYFLIRPSASYGGVFKAISMNGSGLDSGPDNWDTVDSGDTSSVTGNDMLEIAIAGCRTSTGEPTTTSFPSPHTTGHTQHLGGNNEVTIVLAVASPSTGEGVKNAGPVTSDGSANEGIDAILVFGDS